MASRLWIRDRALAVALALLLAANLAFGVAYVIGEDKDAYYLPSFLALTLAAAFGAQSILGWARDRAPAAAAALALLPALPLVANHAYADRSRYFIAEDYVANALASMAPGGMLLTGDWQLYSPLLYSMQVEGRRQDVVAIDLHLLAALVVFRLSGASVPGSDRAGAAAARRLPAGADRLGAQSGPLRAHPRPDAPDQRPLPGPAERFRGHAPGPGVRVPRRRPAGLRHGPGRTPDTHPRPRARAARPALRVGPRPPRETPGGRPAPHAASSTGPSASSRTTSSP